MSEINTSQQREEERRRRRRQQLMRKRQREAKIRRGIFLLTGCLLALGLVWAVFAMVKNSESGKPQENKEEEQLQAVDVEEVLHLSFETLAADPERAFNRENPQDSGAANRQRVTVGEFRGILQQLYDRGYVLVRMQDVIEEKVDKDGKDKFSKGKIYLPKGKKPLILSQQEVNYYFDTLQAGYASKIVLDASGNPVCEYIQADGETVWGSYDLIPCLNDFIRQHPDFSYNGARGILGVTGYQGILGYRTDPKLAKTKQEGNPYADYGTFDYEEETRKCREVVEVLKAQGWEFAANGYQKISYGSDHELVERDAQQWETFVESIVGETESLIFPYGTDIASRRIYDKEDERFVTLQKLGFRYFYGEDSDASWIQVQPDYVRQMRIVVSGELMYRQMQGGKTGLADVFDAAAVYDRNRPPMASEEEPKEEAEEEPGEE